jgi:SNF2 family DNA or RNA helicase
MFFPDVIEKENYYIIRDFPIRTFLLRAKQEYKTSRLNNLMEALGIFNTDKRKIKIHKFFIPELLYLLKKFNFPRSLIEKIEKNTWVYHTNPDDFDNRINWKIINNEMSVTFKEHQAEFINDYDIMRQVGHLYGYILSFDQGVGKTMTALGLASGLNKEKIIIIAPNNTLETVWAYHIQTFFKSKQIFQIVKDEPYNPNARFYICNYEAMEKLKPLVDDFKGDSSRYMVICDEVHNFLSLKSNRTQNLIKLRKDLNINDFLLMSGTPIKGSTLETIPLLFVIDKYFDEQAMVIYKKSFGVNSTIATDVLRSRVSLMMHRKTKEEVLPDLPKKYEEDIKVKIPNGKEYTVTKVIDKVKKFVEERTDYWGERKQKYTDLFYEVLDYIEYRTSEGKSEEFKWYLKTIEEFRKSKVNLQIKEIAEKVTRANNYEKNILIPLLPTDLKKQFIETRTVVKYLHLKISGEVIGQLLTRLRMEMTMDLVKHANITDIINESLKKTILFTYYTDTIEYTRDYLIKEGFEPVTVYGKSKSDVLGKVQLFQTKHNGANPMIASLKMMSTGVTLTAANTVIFLNKPWRHYEYVQASDRILRIGQDTDCYIYSLVLDTGNEPNMSDRMSEIISASKDLFEAVIENQEDFE